MPSATLVAAAITSALGAGVLPSFLRGARPFLQDRLALSETQVRRLGRWFSLFTLPCLPLAGLLVDRWGLHEILFLGCLGLAMAISWIALSVHYGSLIWGLLGLAASGACVFTAAITLMPAVLQWSGHDSRAEGLSVGFLVLGASWLLTPVLLPPLLRRLGHHQVLLSLAFLYLVPAALVVFTPKGEFPTSAAAEPMAQSLHDPRLWLLASMVLCYFLIERTLSVWPRPYLAEIGYQQQTIKRLLLGFWISYLCLRPFWGWLIGPGYETWLVLVFLVTAAMILGNLVGAYGASSGYLGFWLVGACFGPLLPLVLSIAMQLGEYHGFPALALGILMAFYPLTNLLIHPWFVRYAESHTARASMRIPMLLALLMAAPTLVLALIRPTS